MEEENQIICNDCGTIIEEGEQLETPNGDIICQDCFDNNYICCERCNDIVANDDAVCIQGTGEYVCESCAESYYYYCNDCGEWFDYSNGGIHLANGDYVCESCAESYCSCDCCGEYYHEDDINWNDEDSTYYCNNCMEQMENERIYNYHEFRNWTFYKKDKEDTPPFYIGYELEIQPTNWDRDRQTQALEVVKNNLNAVAMRDGSLGSGGFEIVSHPQTFEYILTQKEKMQETFSKLIELGYTSHDNDKCGLHFHISRPENPEIIDRLWLVLETYKKEIVALSRRTRSQLGRWAQFLSDAVVNDAEKLQALYFIKKTDKNYSRYLALNNENRTTIEFRFFKGSLKFETFMGALEFINNLVTLCSDLTLSVECITWDKLCEGAYIRDYINERGIHANFKPVDKSIKLIRKENAEKIIINRIIRQLTQHSRELLQAEHIKKTNLKGFDDFRIKAREISKYYNELYNGFFDMMCYLQNDADKMRVRDFIERLSSVINYNSFNNKELEKKIKDNLKELKRIEEEKI